MGASKSSLRYKGKSFVVHILVFYQVHIRVAECLEFDIYGLNCLEQIRCFFMTCYLI